MVNSTHFSYRKNPKLLSKPFNSNLNQLVAKLKQLYVLVQGVQYKKSRKTHESISLLMFFLSVLSNECHFSFRRNKYIINDNPANIFKVNKQKKYVKCELIFDCIFKVFFIINASQSNSANSLNYIHTHIHNWSLQPFSQD